MNIAAKIVLVFLLPITIWAQSGEGIESNNPFLADPTIFYADGVFYLYGTTGKKVTKEDGFTVYTSTNLMDWEGPLGASNGLALKKGDAFGDKGFWAPQVLEYNDHFYMFYTANEHIAYAVSDSPLGPFKNSSKEDLKAPVKQIDPFLFFDEDGKKYLYHVRLTDGNRIFAAELNNNLSQIKSETLTECISGTLDWENTQNSDWPVTEGPTVLKHKGLYYMIYSANDFRNPDYAVGYATSKSPLGPWEKSERPPFISRELIGVNGTGHGDVIVDPSGDLYYVFHTHNSEKIVQPRKTAIAKISFVKNATGPDYLTLDKGSFRFLNSTKP